MMGWGWGWATFGAGSGAILGPVLTGYGPGLTRSLMRIVRSHGWKLATVVLAGVVVIQFVSLRPELIYRVRDWLESRRRSLDHLLTRPVCESGDCPNFNFLVRECELQATQVGGLLMTGSAARADVRGATEHFRGCLLDRGLSWEPCERGDPGCRFLRAIRTEGRSLPLPSFVVE